MRLDQQVRGRGVGVQSAPAPAGLAIPFDYVAEFRLTGEAGRVVEAVINTDVDGTFVAEAISYGFEPQPRPPLRINVATSATSFNPTAIQLGMIDPAALIRGFRISPDAINSVLRVDPAQPGRAAQLVSDQLPVAYAHRMLEPVDARRDFSFLFSMIDTATGRELQDEPTHSVASLGSAYGRRPFRRLAQPMSFQPRSTLRLQVVELTSGKAGKLYIVLQGQKQLQVGTCPDTVKTALRAFQELQQGAIPSGRIIPFDYVAAIDLLGIRGRRDMVEVPVNVEGGFVATSIGYGVQPADRDVQVTAAGGTRNLATLTLGDFPPDALLDGIRVRPDLVRLALLNNGQLATSVPNDTVQTLFERLNGSDDVAFLYRFHDTGTGRELQNRPIHNIAGLGSADGHRPFRQLTRPLVLLPNSALRVEIEEQRGRGRLFIVFQGFKVLGGAPMMTADVARVARRAPVRR